MTDACPCGSGDVFDRCCRPLHTGGAPRGDRRRVDEIAVQRLRGRDLDYVWRTWHPRTRPEVLTPSDEAWTGLEIVDTEAGQQGDEEGEVEFRAHYRRSRRSGTLHERSHFAVRARRWFYVDGELFG